MPEPGVARLSPAATPAEVAAYAEAELAGFFATELNPGAPQREEDREVVIDGWLAGARRVGGGSRPLFVGRGYCELADQWLYARLPSLVGAAREQLLLDGAAELAVTARRPLAGFHGEYFKPMYFGDRGTVDVEAWQAGARTVVVHRVHGAPLPGAPGGDQPLCALALEVF